VSTLPRQRGEGGRDDQLDVEEVKALPGTVWWLNDNFVILGIEGVLNMLNGEGCQELGQLRDLAGSHNAVVLEDVPRDVHKLAGCIV
jgi:hypothetical protein